MAQRYDWRNAGDAGARRAGRAEITLHPCKHVPNRISCEMAHEVNRVLDGKEPFHSKDGLVQNEVLYILQKHGTPFRLDWSPEGVTLTVLKG